ncbi:MAG: hypothetical protein AAB392_01115, partial [Patescibacteria group bacterium]
DCKSLAHWASLVRIQPGAQNRTSGFFGNEADSEETKSVEKKFDKIYKFAMIQSSLEKVALRGLFLCL